MTEPLFYQFGEPRVGVSADGRNLYRLLHALRHEVRDWQAALCGSRDDLDSLCAVVDAALSANPWAATVEPNAWDTLDNLAFEYEGWCKREGLPLISADEHDPATLNEAQHVWLSGFSLRWRAAEDAAKG
jgi:hypothetical protein